MYFLQLLVEKTLEKELRSQNINTNAELLSILSAIPKVNFSKPSTIQKEQKSPSKN